MPVLEKFEDAREILVGFDRKVSGISIVLTLFSEKFSLKNFKTKSLFCASLSLNIISLGTYNFVVIEGMFMFSVYR